jgi:hypothetical protein
MEKIIKLCKFYFIGIMVEIEDFVLEQLRGWAERLPPDKRKAYRLAILTAKGEVRLTIDDLINELKNKTEIGKKYCEMIMAGIREMFQW